MNRHGLRTNELPFVNGFANFVDFKRTWWLKEFINLDHKIIGLFLGNQTGKTAGAIYQYILRFLGIHPIPHRNVVYLRCVNRYCPNGHSRVVSSPGFPRDWKCGKCGEDIGKFTGHTFHMSSHLNGKPCPECGKTVKVYQRGTRIYRFCSESLPTEKTATAAVGGQSAEIKNTVYPALKKWLPPSLMKKDIVVRNPSMTLRDIYGGPDIICEFSSYNMQVQGTAGVQRAAIYCDEQPPADFLEEQRPRLIAEDGDIIIGCTPAIRLTYLYDEIFEKAKLYIRSQTIADKYGLKQIEHTDSPYDIAVVQAATDDNVTLGKDAIEKQFESVDDPDILSIRRYGIFKQVSGRIFKSFDYAVHFIDKEKWFPDGIPYKWTHGRFIDYHPHVAWAIINMSISQYDEAFVWAEYNPSPETITTYEIARETAVMGRDYKFTVNLIDPLSVSSKKDGITVLDDINRAFYDLKTEGIGEGGYWQGWDTKSFRGRDEIKKRLKNSIIAGRPFNNIQIKNGKKIRMPTIWILNNCKLTAKSMRNWRLEEWANSSLSFTRDMKETPQQKWSHFNMCIEAAFKHRGFRAKSGIFSGRDKAAKYFRVS